MDASASSNVTGVSSELSGGTLTGERVVPTATPTIYGWIAKRGTTSVHDGTYTLQGVASYAGGVNGQSSPVTITVSN